MKEFDLIAVLRARCAIARDDVVLGIGDDAALLAVPLRQRLAVSTDTLVAGVHFPQDANGYAIGWKALAVNLSDLAAMGAEPAWATLALTLPQTDAAWVEDFAEGFATLARQFRVALVGGDTTQGPLSITVTIHGFVPDAVALTRSGARVGDGLYVTGTLGDAAAGLRLREACSEQGHAALLARLDRPTPRVVQGLILRGCASACIDISDGLVADLAHICVASGVGAAIDADAAPASPELLATFDGPTRRELQLAGGDDYELCFTAAESAASALLGDLARSGCGATRIGRIIAAPGVHVHDALGRPVTVPRGGWEHFA